MKVLVSEATPRQLDWMASVALGEHPVMIHDHYRVRAAKNGTDPTWHIIVQPNVPILVNEDSATHDLPFRSSSWADGGPIIERERITISDALNSWVAGYKGTLTSFGPTPLIAAMRCLVTAKLGHEAEVPESLNG